MGFTVTIPNNSSEKYYPDNSQSHFKIYLPKELNFETKYEVALLELMYNHHFYNLIDQWIEISYTKSGESKKIKINLVDGYYSNTEELIEEINDTIKTNSSIHKSIKSKINIEYSELTKKTTFTIKSNVNLIVIKLSEKLSKFFGIEINNKDNHEAAETFVSNYPCDVFRGLHSMYVYTNIIERQIVGDSLVPLLRIIGIDNKNKDEHVTVRFNNLRYLPISLNNIRTIEIDLRNEYGERLPFQSGTVIASLHFRKCYM